MEQRPDITQEQARLEALPIRSLTAIYEQRLNEVCRSTNKRWLIKRILWRIQADAEGGISERARRRASEIADETDLRLTSPEQAPIHDAEEKMEAGFEHDPRIPLPGTELIRVYKGRRLSVIVLADGFEYADEHYKSLSAVAKAITGTHTNGFLFFGLKKGGK